jgi:hypothetical protein
MTHKLEIELTDKMREDLQASADDWQYTLEQMALHAIQYFLEDLEEEDSDDDIIWDLRRALTELKEGKTIPIEEVLGSRREKALSREG